MPTRTARKKTPPRSTGRKAVAAAKSTTSKSTTSKSATSKKKNRLGRGLDALLGVSAQDLTGEIDSGAGGRVQTGTGSQKPASAQKSQAGGGKFSQVVDLNQLSPSPFQPRRNFQTEVLEELAASVREHGVLQPIVVRKGSDNTWEIVAGERRWRAARLAKLKKIPVVVKELSDSQAVSIALVENLQRVDLNPVEKARGIARLQEQSGCDHQEIAGLLGCSRAAVTNLLRLLKLNPEVLNMLSSNELQAGHARALLSLDGVQQARYARKIVREGMSTSAVEKMVRGILNPKASRAGTIRRDGDTRALERELSDRLGAQVSVHSTRRGGRVVINCRSSEGLEAAIEKLKRVR